MSRPADGLAHPVPLLAVALLVFNDHVLKGGPAPGWLTGKLSDVAGMLFFPLFLQAAAEWVAARMGRRWGPSRRALVASAVATAVVFSLVQVWPPAADAYRWGLGLLQWPPRQALAALAGRGWVGVAPVAVTPDPSDLLTVPFVAVAVAVGWRRSAPTA